MNKISGDSGSYLHKTENHANSANKPCDERLPTVKKLERENDRRSGNQPQSQRVKNIVTRSLHAPSQGATA
jgi:hypothetical protein